MKKLNFNGHSYVDLGLPSGTLWATKPIMSQDNEPLYFAWGGIQGMTRDYIEKIDFLFGVRNYQKGSLVPYANDDFTSTKYNMTDDKTVLDLEDDAAHVYMGGDWHMPTKEQLKELKANTTYTWTTKDDVNGILFTASNGNSLFIPSFGFAGSGPVRHVGSCGFIWSSTVGEEVLGQVCCLYFDSSYLVVSNYGRPFGRIVFGVVG